MLSLLFVPCLYLMQNYDSQHCKNRRIVTRLAMHGYAALCSIWRWLPWDLHAQEYKIPGRIMGVNGNDARDNILHRKQVK